MSDKDEKNTFNFKFNLLPESTTSKLLDPSANVVGKAVSSIFHFLLGPLARYSIAQESELNSYAEKIEKELSKIPIENRDDAKTGLVFKAFEDSKYQLNSEELQDLFAKLISSIVDNRVNKKVHPSFSTLLKDISPEDAVLLAKIRKLKAIPTVDIYLYSQYSRFSLLEQSNILLFENGPNDKSSVSLTSLERLGLIELMTDKKITKESFNQIYESFITSELYKTAKQKVPLKFEKETFDVITPKYNVLKLTSFGEVFCDVVIGV